MRAIGSVAEHIMDAMAIRWFIAAALSAVVAQPGSTPVGAVARPIGIVLRGTWRPQ